MPRGYFKAEKKLKDYYNSYKAKASGDILYYKSKLNFYTTKRHSYRQQLIANYDKYKELGIELDEYPFEYKMGIYSDNKLNKAALKLIDKVTNEEDKKLINDLLIYTNIVKLLNDTKILLEEATDRDNLTYKQYEEYVLKYYSEVARQLLDGYGYNMNYHIGMVFLERVDLPHKEGRKIIDYQATKAAKQKVIDEGKRPYEAKTAALYKARGLKYDGVPYIVYRYNDTFCYKWHFVNSIFLDRLNMEFEARDYTESKMYKDDCYTTEGILNYYDNDIDKVLNSKLGLKQKTSAVLKHDETKYVKFIRFNNRKISVNRKGTFMFRSYDEYIKHNND